MLASFPLARPIYAPLSTTQARHRLNWVAKARLPENKDGQAQSGSPVLSAHESSKPKAHSPDSSHKTPELRGSDVLLALQRAAAEKAKSRKGRRRKRTDPAEKVVSADYSNVRPLSIRNDWGPRLDEMERLLKELQMEEHSTG